MADKKLNCCKNCQIYWTCETKWYRGEKNEESVCCDRCNFYSECPERQNPNSQTGR